MSRDRLLGGDEVDAYWMGSNEVEVAQTIHAQNQPRYVGNLPSRPDSSDDEGDQG